MACTFYSTIVHLLALLKQLQCCMEVDRLEFLSGKFHKICSRGRPCHAALLFKCPEVGDSPLPDRKSLKRAKRLSSDFLSLSVSKASTITVEAITTIQTRKNSINHRVWHSPLIVIVELELFFSDSQALRCQCLVLYAILLEYNIIHSKYAPDFGRQQPKSGGITQNIERGCACMFSE